MASEGSQGTQLCDIPVGTQQPATFTPENSKVKSLGLVVVPAQRALIPRRRETKGNSDFPEGREEEKGRWPGQGLYRKGESATLCGEGNGDAGQARTDIPCECLRWDNKVHKLRYMASKQYDLALISL